MAKKKSSPVSSFVPEEEQPYPIPENWCWTRLKVLVEVSKEKTNDFSNGDTKYVGLEHIEKDGGIIGYSSVTEVKSLKAIFHVGQILYGKLRPYLNKHDIAGFEGVCSTDILVFDTKNCADSRYVNYFFNQRYFIEYAVSNSKGINLPRVSESIILEAICPLPPLTEQRRIVDRIESLFAKLEEAKEKAQAVVDSFELRKFAILHKAFTGELTERWRKEHGVGLDSWTDTTIGEQAELITKGASPRWQGVEYTDDKSQTLFVTSENVREGYLDFTKEKYLSNEINDIQKRSILNYGDVLVNIVGASIGRAAIYNLHQLANTNQAVCIVRLKPGISNEFVCTYLNAPIAQSYYYDNKVETARANISLGSISAMYINLPTSAEQKEIVDTLNMVLEMEHQAKEAAEAVLSQIDIIKKAILARAFRGELGTNDPAEEWAGELVKAVL